jgi:hypothetical protein
MNISERQNNINNLKSYLQEDIDADYELINYIFFDKGDIVGIIYCLEALEKGDEHCDRLEKMKAEKARLEDLIARAEKKK